MVSQLEWTWRRWRLGEGEFESWGRANKLCRPKDLPRFIPPTWWVRLVAFLARRHVVKVVPAPASPWSQNGLWIVNLNPDGTVAGILPRDFARMAVNGQLPWCPGVKFSWVCVQIVNEGSYINVDRDIRFFVDEAKKGGLYVGGWGYHGENPESEAAAVQKLMTDLGMDKIYGANVEAPYKTINDGVSKLQRLASGLKGLSVCGFTYSDARPMPVKTMLDNGWHVTIECYWNEGEQFRPADGAAQAHDAGVPAERLHICFGLHSSKLTKVASSYFADVPLEVKGISLYPAELAVR